MMMITGWCRWGLSKHRAVRRVLDGLLYLIQTVDLPWPFGSDDDGINVGCGVRRSAYESRRGRSWPWTFVRKTCRWGWWYIGCVIYECTTGNAECWKLDILERRVPITKMMWTGANNVEMVELNAVT